MCWAARAAGRIADGERRTPAYKAEDLPGRRRRSGNARSHPGARQFHGIRAALPGADLRGQRLLRLLDRGHTVGGASACPRTARRRHPGLHSARPHAGRDCDDAHPGDHLGYAHRLGHRSQAVVERTSGTMDEPVTVPLWLLVAIAAFALWSLLDRLLIPSGRWLLRRRLNPLIDSVQRPPGWRT